MAIDLAAVYDGARQAGFPVDGMANQTEVSSETTRVSVRVNHGKPTDGKYNDCWLFFNVHQTTVDGQPYYHVYGTCDDSQRRESVPGSQQSADGTDLASCIRVVITRQGITSEGYLKPCWETRTARDARRRARDTPEVVPVGEPWTAHDEEMAEQGAAEQAAAEQAAPVAAVPVVATTPAAVPVTEVVEEEESGSRMPIMVALGAIALIAVFIATAALAHLGPFAAQPVASKSAGSPATGSTVVKTPPAVGLMLTGHTMDLKFSNPKFGACPPAMQQATPPNWGGGWVLTAQPGAGTDVAINATPAKSSPFGNYLNGPLMRSGRMMISGDSTIENQVLRLVFAKLTLATVQTSLPVTGATDVTLHGQGGQQCNATYDAAGTVDPAR